MKDNLVVSIGNARQTVLGFKRKLANARLVLDQTMLELDKLDTRLEEISAEADNYKLQVQKIVNREVREVKRETRSELYRMSQELNTCKKQVLKAGGNPVVEIPESNKSTASTVLILDTVMRHMCDGADDFRRMCEAVIYPSVYAKLIFNDESDALYLHSIPDTAEEVIQNGRELLALMRSEYSGHLTDEEAWNSYQDGVVVPWLKSEALPLLYGNSPEDWEDTAPLSRAEILNFEQNTADRMMIYPEVYDAMQMYGAYMDVVLVSSGVLPFERKFQEDF
jgi:hypothetical protein